MPTDPNPQDAAQPDGGYEPPTVEDVELRAGLVATVPGGSVTPRPV